MGAIRQPLLGLPPTVYLRAPTHRPGITSLAQPRCRLHVSLRFRHKGIWNVFACTGGGLSSRKQKVRWRITRRQGAPRCKTAAGAQVSQIPNADWNGNIHSSPGIWNALSDTEGCLSSRKQNLYWRIHRRQGAPRWKRVAGAQVSQVSNANRNGNVQTSSENLLSAQEFFDSFLRSRQLKSDFVSKASDVLWKREVFDVDEEKLNQVRTKLAELQKLREEDDSSGFLKLSQARQWGLGVDGAPTNAKQEAIDMQTLGDDRWRAGLLEYEALKRELSLLTAAIAAFCSIYCGLVFSLEDSVSYAIGSLGSLLYLQLLFRHVDQFSEENVAAVFLRRRQKKIGIRSSDLQDGFEKAFFGSGSALSSPRLVIPVLLYGLWTLAHRLGDLPLDLQITPLMFGFFAYKAALLVQAFRENKDLAMSFEKENQRRMGG